MLAANVPASAIVRIQVVAGGIVEADLAAPSFLCDPGRVATLESDGGFL